MLATRSPRRILGICSFVLIGLVAAGVGGPVFAAPPISATNLGAAFASYGDGGGRWAGGDGSVSVELPDGRIAWLFSDTFVGAVNPDHSLASSARMVNNTIVVQQGTQLTTTVTGGTASAPTAVVTTGVADEFYWVGDAAVEGAELKVIYNRFRRTGTGPLDFALVGSWLATLSLPALTVTSLVALPTGSDIAWGASLVANGGYTYVYGTELTAAGGMKFAHLARVPVGGLSGAWQFWTGSAWSSDPASSARLLSGVGSTFGVQFIGGQFVLVTVESNIPFNAQVVAYTATAPTGPFAGPVDLFTAPEPAAGGGKPIIVYNAQLHPEQAPSGQLLVSYDVNSLDGGDVTADIRIYRPRFVEVAWPQPTPNPGSLPAAPTNLVATADAAGIAHLSWQAPSGLTFRVYRRDVTSGQSHFARVLSSDTTSADVGMLTTGRTYEFRVAAVNASGEGPMSTVASVSVVVAPPPAPTSVAAVASPNGKITVSWSAVPYAWHYEVYQRDITAGDPEAQLVNGGTTNATTLTTGTLQHQHAYEFTVKAYHGGGGSPASAPTSATAFYVTPGAPTGLTATAATDGTIQLNWTAPGPDVWFNVYQRDVTAGEPSFTRLPLPVTLCCTMTAGFLTHGHVYEYKVAATNSAGEGPASVAASATSTYAPPETPANLTATPGNGQVVLNWTAPSTPSWYWIFVRDVTAGEANFTKLEWPLSTCCTFTGTYLTNGHQYEFKIAAIGSNGGPDSAFSNVVSATPMAQPPTNLTATAGDGQVVLNFTESVTPSWYWIYVRDVTAGEANFTKLEWPLTTCCTFTAAYLTNGHTYEFKVTAVGFNGGADSAPSNVVSATPMAPPLAAPTNLVATPGNGQAVLTFTPGPTPSWYWIYVRDVTAGEANFTRLEWPLSTCCTFTAAYLTNGHTYEFKVAAIGGPGVPDSPPSTAVSVVPLAQPPTNLTASAGNGQVVLNFTESVTPSWYWIYVRDVTAGEANFTKLDWPLSTCCTFTAAYLTNGHTYQFKVATVGFNGTLDSVPSNVVSATPTGPPPGAPSNLRATPGNGQAVLNWTASSTPGAWYWIYVRDVTAGEANFTKLEWPLSTCCTFTSTYLINGHTYQFKVVTIGSPDSEPSNVVSVVPLALPPTNLTATAGNGQVVLDFTASLTPSWYWIYVRDVTAGEANFTKLEWPLTTCCTFTAAYLTNGHTYQFKVAAVGFNGTLDSVASNVVSAKPMAPPLEPPTNLTATAGDGQVMLSWVSGATPSWYWIYMRDVTAGEANFTKLEWPDSTCCTFTAAYLSNGHTYEFKVAAAGNSGQPDSVPSNVVSSRPMPPFPQAPSGLTASVGNASVTLNWTASPTPGVYYWIYQRDVTTGQSWQRLPWPVTSCCTFNGGYLVNGHTYEWRMTAANLSGISGYTNIVSGRPMPPFPQPPTGLTATTGDASVTLHWTASPTPGVYYWIYQRDVTGGGGFVKLPYPILTCCTFNGGLLINGRTYEWKIAAANEAGTSGYSNTVSGRPMPPLPSTPGNVHATATGPGSVNISWTGNTSTTSTTFYYLSYRLAGDTLWTNLPYPITARSWGFYDNNYRGDLYQFSVYANNITGSSGAGNSNTVMLPDSRPGTVVHSGNNNNGANTLGWTMASGNCDNRGWQAVCYDSFAPINPWTVGDWFLYPDDEVDFDNLLHCEAARRANIRYAEGRSKADSFGPDVLRHEERHSEQWAGAWSASIFIVQYVANPDKYEQDANLYWGNYRNYMTERGITDRFSSGTLCMGYISIH